MNRIKTFVINVSISFHPEKFDEKIDTVVNRWVEENQVTVVNVSVAYGGLGYIIVLLYEGRPTG